MDRGPQPRAQPACATESPFAVTAATARMHCPCHEGVFDLATGRNIAGPPPRPLPAIELDVVGDEIFAIGVKERTV